MRADVTASTKCLVGQLRALHPELLLDDVTDLLSVFGHVFSFLWTVEYVRGIVRVI